MTHDYTKKGGVIHSEIILPTHAPAEFRLSSINPDMRDAFTEKNRAELILFDTAANISMS